MMATPDPRPKLTADQRRELAAARRAKVQELRDRLDAFEGEIDESVVAEIIYRYSDYSARNAMLIAMQCPEATEVHGFTAWKDHGRSVKPRPEGVASGEYGLKILAPAGEYDVEVEPATEDRAAKTEPKMRFKIAYVFDISQTETWPSGRPVGPPPRHQRGIWQRDLGPTPNGQFSATGSRPGRLPSRARR
jgi:hypothetical protein